MTGPAKTPAVLFVNHSMAMGGIEMLIVSFVARLRAAGVAARVAVFQGGGSLESDLERRGVPVHRLGKREGVDARMVAKLRRLIRDHEVEVVHSHNFSTWLYTTFAVRSLGRHGPRHVHTEHSNVAPSPRRYWLERRLAALTAHTVAVSGHVRDVMTDRIGIARERVRVIYNGIDTALFAPDEGRRAAMRQALGLGPQEVVLGVVARLAPVKDHATLLRALAETDADIRSQVRLIVVGDGPERAALERLRDELELGDRVRFLGERRDTPALLNAFDIYVLPSLSEGMNLTLLEAMSTALPVVTTSVGGSPEIVSAEETGLLVPPADPTALARALERLIASGELRRRYGEAGRQRVVRMFSQESMLREYLALYGIGEG